MILSRAHTSAKAGDAAKLLLLNIEHTQRYEYDSAPPPPTNPVSRRIVRPT